MFGADTVNSNNLCVVAVPPACSTGELIDFMSVDIPVPRQFASTARLFATQDFLRLRRGHVGVVGLGGVGSWAAEALVRSGVGRVTLVDMDHVAESNLNRQVQATHSSLGVEKGRALAARLADIAPGCGVTVIDEFLTPENVQRILLDDQAEEGHTVWIDATDDLAAKRSMAVFMANSKRLKDLVVSGGAGGKTDPTRVEASDLSESTHDALLSTLRYDLRKHCGFPRQGKMKIQTVFSRQMTIKMDDCDPSAKLSCAGYGSMVTVTASMGMAVAYLAISRIIES